MRRETELGRRNVERRKERAIKVICREEQLDLYGKLMDMKRKKEMKGNIIEVIETSRQQKSYFQ